MLERHVRFVTRASLLAACLVLLLTLAIGTRSEPQVSASGGVVQVAAGGRHTCALMEDSGVKCWGENDSGALGDGTTNTSTSPVDVCESGSGVGCSGGVRLTGVEAISAGPGYTCALMDNATVKCWGANSKGRLGDGTDVEFRTTAGDVCESGSGGACEPLTQVQQVSAGAAFTCALMEDTTVRCWGANTDGQLGIDSMDDQSHPVPDTVCAPALVAEPLGGTVCAPVSGFIDVDGGGRATCGVRQSGGVMCWGRGARGQLGNGDDASHATPVDVCTFQLIIGPVAGDVCVPISGAVDVSAGGSHACALMEDATVRCWGRNSEGALGDGTTEDERLTPVRACASGSGPGCEGGQTLGGIESIVAGDFRTCAIAEAGDVRCWGDNLYGSLGDGTMTDRANPVPVSGLGTGATTLDLGSRHACASADGTLWCWGSNDSDQLGAPAFDECQLGDCSLVPLTVNFGPKDMPTPTDENDTPTATSTPSGPTPTSTPQGPTPTPGGLAGDVDCSGDVTAIDAAFLLQLLAGLLQQLPCPENADVNQDGETNSIDAALILQYSAGLINSLPP